MKHLVETLREEAFTTIAQARFSVRRQFEFPRSDTMIKVAIGMRRTGKSYFLYQTINKLIDEGVSKEQILFINFEDDRLLPMTSKEMGRLIDAFYELYPDNHHKRCYLFFDEVQNIPEWHTVIRRYFDSKDTQIYLTGSSAKLLSKEINTTLRGRSLSVEILPYSLSEYLDAHQIKRGSSPFGQASFDKMKQHLDDYFLKGGFPGVQHMPVAERRQTLQGYLDTVILRDIIERHGVSNTALLNYLAKTLIKSFSSVFSVNKFYNDVKSQGFKVGKETIHNYLAYLQDAFLVFTAQHYAESERLKQNRPKKLYVIDSALVKAVSMGDTDNHGRLLENLVYLDLRRQKKTVYFYTTADGHEVDFVIIDEYGNRELLQICWDVSDEKTLEREQRALEAAEKELGITGRILTLRDYLQNATKTCN